MMQHATLYLIKGDTEVTIVTGLPWAAEIMEVEKG